MKTVKIAAGIALLASLLGSNAYAEETMPQHIKAIKAALAASKTALKSYQWVETTTISRNGEVKSTRQQRAYYGVDGTVQKVDLYVSPAPAGKPGLRGKIIANKTAEVQDYMQDAAAMIKAYIPPSAEKIEAARAAGGIMMSVPASGTATQVDIANYERPGDKLGITVDLATNRILGFQVNTYLADPSDAVSLVAQMGKLPDGTSYVADTMLNVPAKGMTVEVQNSGHQRTK